MASFYRIVQHGARLYESPMTVSSSSPWTVEGAEALLQRPLPDLLFEAASVHRQHFPAGEVQLASLLSIKTGGCPEDCSYCPQSAHFSATGTTKEDLLPVATVLEAAHKAKNAGASRFCMGAAWRSAPKGNPKAEEQFNRVCDMVRGVRDLGMEACVTLGMLSAEQAARLKEAGLTAYNHNLDTGEDYYNTIISTRTYDDRLTTLKNVAAAGISTCCGGIIGMGESWRDRAQMLTTLASLTPTPQSVPINALVAAPGTPLASRPPVDPLDLVRMVAGARIMLPSARVRLSAGRAVLSREAQVLCFIAGANSIFYGEKLLTTGNNDAAADRALLAECGLETA
jgi:biotin synthase